MPTHWDKLRRTSGADGEKREEGWEKSAEQAADARFEELKKMAPSYASPSWRDALEKIDLAMAVRLGVVVDPLKKREASDRQKYEWVMMSRLRRMILDTQDRLHDRDFAIEQALKTLIATAQKGATTQKGPRQASDIESRKREREMLTRAMKDKGADIERVIAGIAEEKQRADLSNQRREEIQRAIDIFENFLGSEKAKKEKEDEPTTRRQERVTTFGEFRKPAPEEIPEVPDDVEYLERAPARERPMIESWAFEAPAPLAATEEGHEVDTLSEKPASNFVADSGMPKGHRELKGGSEMVREHDKVVIDLEDSVEHGLRDARETIAKQKNAVIEEKIGHLREEILHHQEMLQLYGGKTVSVLDYAELSVQKLLERIEGDLEKIDLARQKLSKLRGYLSIVLKAKASGSSMELEEREEELALMIAELQEEVNEHNLFKQGCKALLGTKAQCESLEEYIDAVKQPIPVEDAEEYLDVGEHAKEDEINEAYAHLMKGLSVENDRDVRQIDALNKARHMALDRAEREEAVAAEKRRLIEETNRPDDLANPARSKDPAVFMALPPKKRGFGRFAFAVGSALTAIGAFLGMREAEAPQPVQHEPQVDEAPKETPKAVFNAVTESVAVPAFQDTVKHEEVKIPAPESLVQSYEVKTGDYLLKIVEKERVAIHAPELSTPERISLMKQLRADNHLSKDGHIEPGMMLSVSGIVKTLEEMKKMGSGLESGIGEKTSTNSIEIASKNAENAGQDTDTENAPTIPAESLTESDGSIAPAVAYGEGPQIFQSSEASEHVGADMHIMQKGETLWKQAHNELRENDLNWTSERINFLTQIHINANLGRFRAMVADGRMKKMEARYIPVGAALDESEMKAVIQYIVKERNRTGRTPTVKELAKKYGIRYPIVLTFPS